ncbi:hypothetical protein O6H91_03G016700 [Diphasiastrum complanatum]|uniref:Uncharacterized protein n=1 Tax=Diphasiastrum complanatum TaxID=34168 RepID=A0ACC2E3X8_DIPCM|nr:hypothetical protein O6H91_03G016700 [Diphasiastrum complanatum]
MKIVSYNVNGLRGRLTTFRTLGAFLGALDADIICLQETKISRQELTADIAIVEGYESFFSCTRTTKKGRVGYSGVATFCRVQETTFGTSAILPMAADEGFTGLLKSSKMGDLNRENGKVGGYEEVLCLEGLTQQELLQLDSEGRCLVTDHGSFVLFNIYGPNVGSGDLERQDFKLKFFKGLQNRWEGLLSKGRTIIAVGDFNISPFRIDSCNPGPNFETSLSRRWLRSILQTGGGPFFDVFRTIHPERKEAYTCWSQASGAEEFNYGTRIDLILAAGPCTRYLECPPKSSHDFVTCEVDDCDILTQFKRWKSDSLPRWLGGSTVKLDGSDHAPVYVQLKPQPPLPRHDVPALAARFMPEIRGRQQSLASMFQKKHVNSESCNLLTHQDFQGNLFPVNDSLESLTALPPRRKNIDATENSMAYCGLHELELRIGAAKSRRQTGMEYQNRMCLEVGEEVGCDNSTRITNECTSTRKNIKRTCQSSLHSFLLTKVSSKAISEKQDSFQNFGEETELSNIELGLSSPICSSGLSSLTRSISVCEKSARPDEAMDEIRPHTTQTVCPLTHDPNRQDDAMQSSARDDEDKEENMMVNVALSVGGAVFSRHSKASAEWQRLQQFMAQKFPLCRGHGEPCVSRVVKKAGPNVGRGFYVCARGQGPTSNPEACCDHFEWASSKGKAKIKYS